MLNLLAINLLADQRRMPDETLRFFLRLLRDFDLTQYRVLTPRHLKALHGQTRQYTQVQLARLLRVGLLETGPVLQEPDGKMAPTYRLARPYLLHGVDLEVYLHQTRETLERRGALPSASDPE